MMDAKMRRALALGALLFSAGSAAALEAKMYAVTTWNAGCSGGQRDSWDNMVQDWYDDITDAGTNLWGWCLSGHCGDAYTKEGKLVNGNVVNSRFADLSKVSFGNDHNRMDAADAVMIGTHGADVSSHWQGSMRVNEAGDGNCSVHGTEMEIGDTDLEFLHLSSCNSMDDNQWGNWEKSMAGAHQVDGFHGLMWIGPGLVNDYGDFSDDAFGGSISDSWLDNMYYSNEFNDGADDQCPVAYAVGSNATDAQNRLHNERYDLVFSDPPDSGPTGSGTIWTATYITGCNPAGEDTINN